MDGDQQHPQSSKHSSKVYKGVHVCCPPVMTSVFYHVGRSLWRVSLEIYEAFCGPLLQRGEVNWRGRWWASSPLHRTGRATLCWMKWGVWSVPGARSAASTCPPRWPSSGSACRGSRTRGRVDGCDLQEEQLSLRPGYTRKLVIEKEHMPL